MRGWPCVGFKAMCHLGMIEGTLRIPLMPLEGLSSQPGRGWKYNPGKLHSWSQSGPLLPTPCNSCRSSRFVACVAVSEAKHESPSWGHLGKGLAFMEYLLCAGNLQLSSGPFYPCHSLIRLIITIVPILCGKGEPSFHSW